MRRLAWLRQESRSPRLVSSQDLLAVILQPFTSSGPESQGTA